MHEKTAQVALDYVQATSVLLKRASDELAVSRETKKKANEMRPAIVQMMVDRNIIAETQKEAVDAMLASHDTALNFVKMAADRIARLTNELSKRNLGEPYNEQTGKTAAAADFDSFANNVLGVHTDKNLRSDDAIRAVLG